MKGRTDSIILKEKSALRIKRNSLCAAILSMHCERPEPKEGIDSFSKCEFNSSLRSEMCLSLKWDGQNPPQTSYDYITANYAAVSHCWLSFSNPK